MLFCSAISSSAADFVFFATLARSGAERPIRSGAGSERTVAVTRASSCASAAAASAERPIAARSTVYDDLLFFTPSFSFFASFFTTRSMICFCQSGDCL